MREVIKTPQARRDLIDHADYIARRNMDASDRFLHAAQAALRRIAELPGIGVLRSYANPDLTGVRMWPIPGFPKYLIFYRATDEYIVVIRVLHSSRDIESLFGAE